MTNKYDVLEQIKHCPQCGQELDDGWGLVGDLILGKTMQCHNCRVEWKIDYDTDEKRLTVIKTAWYRQS